MNKAKKKLDYSRMLWHNGGKVLGITILAILSFVAYMRYVTAPFIAKERISNVRKNISLANLSISNVIRDVTKDINYTLLNEYMLLLDPDSCYVFCKDLCKSNQFIIGASIKYRSNFFKGKKNFMPTVGMDDDFFSGDFGDNGDAGWNEDFNNSESKFYFSDVESPDFLNNKYTLPIKLNVSDVEKNCYAIITAYVSQERVELKSSTEIPYPNGKVFIISKFNNITFCQDSSCIGKDAFSVLHGLYGDELVSFMNDNEPRDSINVHLGKDNVFFYQNLQVADRSILYVIPVNDLVEDIFRLTWQLIIGLFLTIAVICAVCVTSIKKAMKKSIEETIRLNEMATAANIQKSMLTENNVADYKFVDMATTLVPAETVGGDLYYWLVHDNLSCFCVGDVSGKGVPAALFMARSISLFRNIAKHNSSPAAIAEAMNADLVSNNDYSMFVTMFIGVYDNDTGVLTYCNAGHNSPLLWSGSEDEQPAFMEACGNLPLGIDCGIPFTEKSIQTTGEDVILLYTDGVTEAADETGEYYGEERLLRFFKEHKKENSEKINENLLKKIKTFAGKADQSDDITILTIRKHKDK